MVQWQLSRTTILEPRVPSGSSHSRELRFLQTESGLERVGLPGKGMYGERPREGLR
jgi:hypothetical protein